MAPVMEAVGVSTALVSAVNINECVHARAYGNSERTWLCGGKFRDEERAGSKVRRSGSGWAGGVREKVRRQDNVNVRN